MPDTSWQEEVGNRVKTIQIVVGALIAGCVGFLAVAAVIVSGDAFEPDPEMAQVMNLVLVLFLVGDLIAWAIAPRMMVAQGRRKIADGAWTPPQGSGSGEMVKFIERTGDAGRLFALYMTRTIVACALLEGVAFFAIIVYLVTGSIVGLAIAVVLVIGLALHMPTRGGVLHWIEDQLRLVEQDRQLRSM